MNYHGPQREKAQELVYYESQKTDNESPISIKQYGEYDSPDQDSEFR
jgi:hypothetical protein